MSKKDFLKMTPKERDAEAKKWESGIDFDKTSSMSERSQAVSGNRQAWPWPTSKACQSTGEARSHFARSPRVRSRRSFRHFEGPRSVEAICSECAGIHCGRESTRTGFVRECTRRTTERSHPQDEQSLISPRHFSATGIRQRAFVSRCWSSIRGRQPLWRVHSDYSK